MAMRSYANASNFEQPVRGYIGRFLNGSQEQVDYVPQSHMRIWYNNQTDGYINHHHSAMEILICIENQYTIIANGNTYVLNVGDILFVPPHMLHEILSSERGIRFVCLFDVDFFSDFQDYKAIDPVFMEPYLCSAKTQPEIYQEVYSSFMQMIDIYFSNTIFWEASIYNLLVNVFISIGRNHFKRAASSSEVTSERQMEHYEKFASLLNYIDSNYTEDLTLEQVANYVGFSKYHFSRLFKQNTNSTFYDYLCHKRIQAAQALLSTDTPITDIAFQTGFNNLTTFCRCFKKCTNCSPSEYRNKFHEDHWD